MAYDDEDVWTEEPEAQEQSASEPYVPPEPEPEPEPPPAAAKKRVYYDDDEEAPPLAPEAQAEPPPKQYAQADIAAGTMTDAAPEPAPAPAPTEPTAKKRRIYYDDDDEAPAAAAGGKKRLIYEEPEGAWATFGRELLHGAPPAVAGAVTGAATGAALTSWGGPVAFGGALVGGIAGGITADVVKDKSLKALGHDDDALRAANAKENPWAYRAGSFLSQAFGGSATAAKQGARVLSGGIAGGWEAGSQLYQGKPLNAADIATQAAAGYTFAGNARPWIRGAEAAGGKFGARFAPTPEAPQPHIPGTPPADVAAPVPPEQGTFPFGAERQPEIPTTAPIFEQPKPPGRPDIGVQPELKLEPPAHVNAEGQYEFGINAPHPDSKYAAETTARNPMPDGAGSAKEATPPSTQGDPRLTSNTRYAKEPEAQPHSAVVAGYGAQAEAGGAPRGGINVLQPGQVDTTVQHAMAYPAPARTQFEPPRPPAPPPEPGPAPLPRDRSLTIPESKSTQGVTEPPIPTDHTRMYQGPGMAPNAFTTNRRAAEQGGPARYVDVNPQSMPFFTPGRDGGFTTRNERYQQQLRPIEDIHTAQTGPGGKPPPPPPAAPPEGPAPGAPAAPAAGAKMASPSLEGKLQAAQTAAQTPANTAQTSAKIAQTAQTPPIPAATAAQVVQTGKPALPPKTAAAVATSQAAGKKMTPIEFDTAVNNEAKNRYPGDEAKQRAFHNGAYSGPGQDYYPWHINQKKGVKEADVKQAWEDGRLFNPEVKAAHAAAQPPAAAGTVPPKAAAAIATSKSKQPQDVLIGVSKAGAEVRVKVKPADVSTFREMLDKWGNREGLMKDLTPFIRDTVLKLVGNMPVYTVSQHHLAKAGTGDAAAFYSRLTNHIVLNRKYANSKVDMEHAILHEGIHAVTAHALKHDPQLKGVVNKIMVDVLQKELSHRAAGGHPTMEPGTSYGFFGPAKNKTPANLNEREFVTEAFTNPKFQELLKRHELSPNVAKALQDYMGQKSPIKSAWDAVVATVRKILNVPEGKTNALEAAMRSTEHSIRLNEGYKQGYMKQVGNLVDVKYKNYEEPAGGHIDAAPAGGQGKVKAYDRDGNEKIFTGSDVHAAAAAARAAGHQPYQIYNMDMTKYKPAQAAPTAAATPPPSTAAAPAGGGQPSVTPPAGAAAAAAAPTPSAATAAPATTLAGAHASIQSHIAQAPSWSSKFPTTKEAAKKLWREGYTAIKNAMDPIEQLKKRATQPIDPEQDFATLARLTKGLGGRFTQMIKHGTFDIETGRVNGKGLDEIIKPINDSPQEFTNYTLAKRAIELEGRGIKTGINMPDARRVVAEEGHRFEPVFRDLHAFQDRVLENLVKSGIISQGAAAKMRQLNKEYVPFYRLVDPNSELGVQLGSGLQTRNPVFKIKGSDKEIFDPILSIIKNTYVFTDLAHRNQALVAMRDFNATLPEASQFMKRDRSSHPIEVSTPELQAWMDKHGILGFADEAMTIFRPNAFKPADDKIRVFNNGKAEVYTVDKDVGKAVNAMDMESQQLWLKIVSTPAKLLRAGAVLSPEFMLRNPIRDMLSAFILSKHGSVPVLDFAVGLKEIFKKSQHYQDWLINGGANANIVSMDRKLLSTDAKNMKGVTDVVKDPRQWLGMLQHLSELSENATRVGMYKRAVEKGVGRREAAYEAREGTLDFARTGSSSAIRALNSMVPFLNVHLEGLDRAARAFRDNPQGFLAKVGAGITMPSVLLWMRNKDDERVQQLPAWQRDLFWIVTTDDWKPVSTAERDRMFANMEKQVGRLDISQLKNTFRKAGDGSWEYNNGTIYRIPKPFELGLLFGSVPERILDSYFKENPRAFSNLGKSVERAFVPNYIPQIALPFMEQWANRSMFLDRNLLTEAQLKLPPAQQYGPHTSETAKVLGGVIRSVAGDKSSFGSPVIIDNYLRQWSGGLGKHVTDLVDAGIKKTQDRAPAPETSPADMPLYKAFVARFPDSGAQAIQDFYDMRNDRKTEQAGIKELTKTDPKAADVRVKAAGGEAYVGNDFAKLLKADRDTVTQIMQDKKMSPADKRAAIDLTYLLMIEHAKQAVKMMDQTKRKPAP